jgi:hypothetical protein
MHPNRFTSTRGRRKATTKPAAASVPFRAADHLRNAKEIIGCSHCLGAFDLPAAQCDASTGPRPPCWLDRPYYSIFAIERSQTPKEEIDLAKKRYKELVQSLRRS